jgi:RNA polymerase sigma factor (sigma-70 family)
LGPDPTLRATVSEAVSRALTLLDQLEEPRELRRWLIIHLISVVRQRLRSRRHWRWLSFLRRQRDSALSAAEMPGVSAQQQSTYRLLDRLGDKERIALCLAIFDGMEPAEIATVLGTSVAHVRRLLERAEVDFARLQAR